MPVSQEHKRAVKRKCNRAWYNRNRTKARQISRDFNRQLRVAALAFLGNICVGCGHADKRVLQIDHINGGGWKETRRIGTQGVWRRVLSGSPDYQLLCANCNWVKKHECKEVRKWPDLQT